MIDERAVEAEGASIMSVKQSRRQELNVFWNDFPP
jgi:hypothetical protein